MIWYATPGQEVLAEAFMYLLLVAFGCGVLLLGGIVVVEMFMWRWYDKRQSAQDNPPDPVVADTVGADVVRPRARHKSIFPRVK